MSAPKVRNSHDVSDNPELKAASDRYKVLRQYIKDATVEQKELQDKLGIALAEHSCDELLFDGIPIARLTEYSFDQIGKEGGKQMRATHPRLWKRWATVVFVSKVDVP